MKGQSTRGVLRRDYMRKYQREYLQRAEVRRRLESPEARRRARAYAAEYRKRSGVRATRAAYMRQYVQRPEVKKRLRGRAAITRKKESAKRYRASISAKGRGKKNTKKKSAPRGRIFPGRIRGRTAGNTGGIPKNARRSSRGRRAG